MTISGHSRRIFVPAYQKYIRKAHDLGYLFLELTHDCNLQCLHCGSDCTRNPSATRLSAAVILKTLTEIREAYKPRHHRITVALSGGEPLCYPGLFRLGKAITALEFPWGIVTNGFAWSASKIREAKEAGMASITVSLDGLAEEHDWLRGRKSSFDKAVATIGMLSADRFWQSMDVVTCVNKRNLQTLDALHRLLVDLKVPSWRLFVVSPIGRATKIPELFLDPAEFHRLLEMIRAFRTDKRLHVCLSESGYIGSADELCVRDQYYFCKAGINVAGIMVNGDILACPNIDRRFRQGNVNADSFVEVWENKYQQFRDRSWMRTGRCGTCSEWKMCQGNSFHLWDVDAGRPKLCHLREFGLGKSNVD